MKSKNTPVLFIDKEELNFRDSVAAVVIGGMMASPGSDGDWTTKSIRDAAALAFDLADAMVEERRLRNKLVEQEWRKAVENQ